MDCSVISLILVIILITTCDFSNGHNSRYFQPPTNSHRRIFQQPQPHVQAPFSANNVRDNKLTTAKDNTLGCTIPYLEYGMDFYPEQCQQQSNHHPACSRRNTRVPIDWTGVISCTFRGRNVKYYSTCISNEEWNPIFYSNCAELFHASLQTTKETPSSEFDFSVINNVKELNLHNNNPGGNSEISEESCLKLRVPDDPRFIFTCKIPEAPNVDTPGCGDRLRVKSDTRIILDCRPPYVSRTGHPNVWICKNGKWTGGDRQLFCITSTSMVGKPQPGVEIMLPPRPTPTSKPEVAFSVPRIAPAAFGTSPNQSNVISGSSKTIFSDSQKKSQAVEIILPPPPTIKPAEGPFSVPKIVPGAFGPSPNQLKVTSIPSKINYPDPQKNIFQPLNDRAGQSKPTSTPIIIKDVTNGFMPQLKSPTVHSNPATSVPPTVAVATELGNKAVSNKSVNATFCPPLLHSSPGVKIECTFRSKLVQGSSCQDPVPVGSEARYSCEEFYETTAGVVNLYRKCKEDGTWTGNGDQYGCVIQCGRSNNNVRTPYITHGTPTVRGQWPWHAAIFLAERSSVGSLKWDYICGGTLISQRAILTAAHCVTFSETTEARSGNSLRIDLGKFHREQVDEFVQSYEVQSIVIHPSYSPYGYDSDIALVVLKRPAKINHHVRPICYPQTSDSGVEELHLSEESVGTVVGWGKDATGNLTDQLHVTALPVVSPRACLENVQESFATTLQTRSTTYCAGFTNGTNVCNGDSGGGMYFPFKNSDSTRWYLQGIVSVGIPDRNGNCDPTRYSIFTRVGRYADWIVRQLTEHNA